jgi:hypothetical protein
MAFEIDWDGDLNLLEAKICSLSSYDMNHKSGLLLVRSRLKELRAYCGDLCEKLHIALRRRTSSRAKTHQQGKILGASNRGAPRGLFFQVRQRGTLGRP